MTQNSGYSVATAEALRTIRRPVPVIVAAASLGVLLAIGVVTGFLALEPAVIGGVGVLLFGVVLLTALKGGARVDEMTAAAASSSRPLPEVTGVDIEEAASDSDSDPEPEPSPERPGSETRDVEAMASRIEELQGALAHAEELFDRFVNFAPIGVIVADREGCILRFNRVMGDMVGQSGLKAGMLWPALIAEEDRLQAETRAAQLQAGEIHRAPIEVKLGTSNGRVARIFTGWIDDDRGHRLMTLYVIDATEQRTLEAQFAQGQKMQAIGQLAGGVAHDFNNLLTAMIGFSDLLLMRHPPGDPSYTDIVHIKQNANRAAALVRQLLAFSRRQTMRPKVLSLTDVLADLSDLLRRLIGEHLNIRIVHDRDLGLVRADQGQIEQVVTNLVVNARDAMGQGGTVSIETRNLHVDRPQRVGDETMPVGNYVEIAVIDTGHGIAPEHLGKIFEPFFTTKEVGHGTGLGLSTVYGIVRQTGGFLAVESEVGKGTTFRVMLPRIDAEREVAPTRVSAVDLTGQGTVLLVEDEDAVRLFAARALRNKGYKVLEADSGETALEIIEDAEDEIDLMVSDVVMPNMDGPTLIRRARLIRPGIRAVFISGYAEEAFRRSLGDDLVDVDFLSKPFSLKDLAAKVKERIAT